MLEEALADIEAKLAATKRAADALVAAVRKLQTAAAVGNIPELEKGLEAVGQRAQDAAESAFGLAGAWKFDARNWLATGYADELVQSAAGVGVKMFKHDGRIYCFPLLLKPEPATGAVRVGRKLERRIRPSVLAKQLAAMQKRPQRLREPQFLELLHKAYVRLAGNDERRGSGAGPLMALLELHSLLTLLPGADYPVEEFGRDLLLLARQPDLTTRSGARFEFEQSRLPRVVVFDEEGREREYRGIRFIGGT